MKYIYTKKAIYFFMVVLSLNCLHTVAQAENSSLFDRINTIRKAPFAYGLTLGLSQSQLSASGLTQSTSFDPYDQDDDLDIIAFQLNESSMGIESNQDEQIPVSSQISDVGGILRFSNFISQDTAGKIFVDNLFEKEIESGVFQYILSNDYAAAGTSVLAGTAQGYPNSWFFTLCFDTKSSQSEAVLLTLINQLRADPWAVVMTEILNNNLSGAIDPLTARSLLRKRPPVFLNRYLLEAARITVQEGGETEDVSVSGKISGYEGAFLKGFSGNVQLANDDSSEEAIKRVFGKILEEELDSLEDVSGLLNYDAKDIGLAALASENGDGSASMVCSLHTGIPNVVDNEADEKRVYGILYVDQDKDGLYSPGEELSGRDICVWQEDVGQSPVQVRTITTDYAGRFILFLPSEKRYRFSCAPQNSDDDDQSFDLYRYLYRDTFLGFSLPLSEE